MTSPDEQLERIVGADRSVAVWAYTRVSTKGQEDGFSPEAQANEIRAYCTKNGIAEPLVVFEAATAAKPTLAVKLPGMEHEEAAPRPVLLSVLARLADKHASGPRHLVVWKLDRLTRFAGELELIYALLRRHGVTLHSTVAGEQQMLEKPTDPASALMRQILNAFAAYEHATIVLRMQTGRRTKAAKGGWAGGRVPHGYRVEGGELCIDPEQAREVQRVFFLRDKLPNTLRDVAKQLGDDWNHMDVVRILANRNLYSGRYTDPFGRTHQRPDLRILPDDWAAWAEANPDLAAEPRAKG